MRRKYADNKMDFFIYTLTAAVVLYEIFLIYFLVGIIVVTTFRCLCPGREETFLHYYTCRRRIQ